MTAELSFGAMLWLVPTVGTTVTSIRIVARPGLLPAWRFWADAVAARAATSTTRIFLTVNIYFFLRWFDAFDFGCPFTGSCFVGSKRDVLSLGSVRFARTIRWLPSGSIINGTDACTEAVTARVPFAASARAKELSSAASKVIPIWLRRFTLT